MSLKGRRVLIFVEDGYEDLEFWYPRLRLIEEGAEVLVSAESKGIYRSKHGYEAEAEVRVAELNPNDFDCIIIPGGVSCPDRLRRHKEVLSFVKGMSEKGGVVAAICHGPWVLISAEIVRGRRMTSYFSIRDDVENAGAEYVDRSVVVDGNLITSRSPEDLPDFCRAIINVLGGSGQQNTV